MTTSERFSAFCRAMLGTWAGERTSPRLEAEPVKAVWELVLDGSFLCEHWYTSGPEGVLRPAAVAHFHVAGGNPGEFQVAYRGGKIGSGDSRFDGDSWELSHRWSGGEVDARIRLRLHGDGRYEQEVHTLGPEGQATLESRAILVRQR